MSALDESIDSSPHKSNSSIHKIRQLRKTRRMLNNLYWSSDGCSNLSGHKDNDKYRCNTYDHFKAERLLRLGDCSKFGPTPKLNISKDSVRLGHFSKCTDLLHSTERDVNSVDLSQSLWDNSEISDSELVMACIQVEQSASKTNVISKSMCSTPIVSQKKSQTSPSTSKSKEMFAMNNGVIKFSPGFDDFVHNCSSAIPNNHRKLGSESKRKLVLEDENLSTFGITSTLDKIEKCLPATNLNSDKALETKDWWKDNCDLLVNVDVESIEKESIKPHTDLQPKKLVGFQLASFKKINISEKALQAGKSLIEYLDVKLENSVCENNTEDHHCLQSKSKENNLCPLQSDITDSSGPQEKFVGFLTASKKQIHVSKETKSKAANIITEVIEDCENENAFKQGVETLNDHLLTRLSDLKSSDINHVAKKVKLNPLVQQNSANNLEVACSSVSKVGKPANLQVNKCRPSGLRRNVKRNQIQ